MPITLISREDLLMASKDPRFVNVECYKAEPNGHKYAAGDVVTLTGLTNFPEYNGEKVTITSIREDGPFGKAYYIQGRINEVLNWLYEFRLSKE